jgi:hypothetical protein
LAGRGDGLITRSREAGKKMCISSDPEVHAKSVRQYIDMGFTHLQFHCGGPDQREFPERYGRDVLPGIREQQSQIVTAWLVRRKARRTASEIFRPLSAPGSAGWPSPAGKIVNDSTCRRVEINPVFPVFYVTS